MRSFTGLLMVKYKIAKRLERTHKFSRLIKELNTESTKFTENTLRNTKLPEAIVFSSEVGQYP